MHPYPRKLVIPDAKEIAYAAITGGKLVPDEDNRSPTSVLSAHGSDGFGSNSPNSSSADYQVCSYKTHNLIVFSCHFVFDYIYSDIVTFSTGA